MLKFKVGDVLVSTDREEDIIKVVKTNENNDTSTYGIVALEGSCVGDSWYDGKYMWSQGTIETCYKLKENQLKFKIGDKIVRKGGIGDVEEVMDADPTDYAFTYALDSEEGYYWAQESIENNYELAEKNDFEEKRKKYRIISEKREDIQQQILELQAELDNVNYDIINAENEWKKMLY